MIKPHVFVASWFALTAPACNTIHHVNAAGDAAHTLVVVGTGRATAAPDIARVTLGVEARSADPQQAYAESTRKMEAVVTALRAAGVRPEDMQTSAFNLRTEEPPHLPCPVDAPAMEAQPAPMPRGKTPAPPTAPAPAPARQIVYVGTNTVSVVLRDLKRAGQTLGEVIQAGANSAMGIQFEREDPKALLAEAGVKAIAAAKDRAAVLARESGAKLGAVLSVAEAGGGAPSGYGYSIEADVANRAMTMQAPIEQGNVQLERSVRVTFELR